MKSSILPPLTRHLAYLCTLFKYLLSIDSNSTFIEQLFHFAAKIVKTLVSTNLFYIVNRKYLQYSLNPLANYVGQSKVPRILWLHESVPSAEFLVISVCKYRGGCAMKFGQSDMTCGRDCGFCITIMHPTTCRLLCSNSLLRETFLSSPNHTYSLDLTMSGFWLFPLWKRAWRGHLSQPRRASNWMQQPNSGRFQKKSSTSASNNGRINRARDRDRVWARARVTQVLLHFSALLTFTEVNPKFMTSSIMTILWGCSTYSDYAQSFNSLSYKWS
jgi:hypothetical protein